VCGDLLNVFLKKSLCSQSLILGYVNEFKTPGKSASNSLSGRKNIAPQHISSGASKAKAKMPTVRPIRQSGYGCGMLNSKTHPFLRSHLRFLSENVRLPVPASTFGGSPPSSTMHAVAINVRRPAEVLIYRFGPKLTP
jgi:hypothetical protein